MPRRTWPAEVPVYDHLGVYIEMAPQERAMYLIGTGEYLLTGSGKRVKSVVRKAPPDARTLPDRHAMKARGSRKAHYRERFHSGAQCWRLKPQNRYPWGVAL